MHAIKTAWTDDKVESPPSSRRIHKVFCANDMQAQGRPKNAAPDDSDIVTLVQMSISRNLISNGIRYFCQKTWRLTFSPNSHQDRDSCKNPHSQSPSSRDSNAAPAAGEYELMAMGKENLMFFAVLFHFKCQKWFCGSRCVFYWGKCV